MLSKLLAQAENARLAGRRDEATAALDKAQTLDPRNQRAQFIRDVLRSLGPVNATPIVPA